MSQLFIKQKDKITYFIANILVLFKFYSIYISNDQLYHHETTMSIPLSKCNENAHDSFITIKHKLYTDEKTIIT